VSHIILAYENAERRCQDVLLPVPGWSVSLGAMWIGALILIALGILISSQKMEGWIFGSAQQKTWTQQFFTQNGRSCLHLKSSKDLSLEIFEHANLTIP